MKKLKVALSLLLAIILVLLLSSCWDYMDIDELFVVKGVAMDKDMDTGEYILSYEVAKAKSAKEAEIIARVSTNRGITLYDAIRNFIHEIGSKLYWGHTEICFIGKNIAKEGIIPIIDTLAKTIEIKPDILICYSDMENLEDLFRVDDPIHESISSHLVDLFEESSTSGKFLRVPIIDVIKELTCTCKSPAIVLPYFEIVKHDEEKAIIVNGSIAFNKDKYLCKLDEIETRSIGILKDGKFTKGYVISLQNKAFPYASIEVLESKIKINPILENDTVRMEIEMDIKGRLVEVIVSDELNPDNIEVGIKSSFEELLVHQLSSLISRAQKKEKIDFIGFGKIVFRELPDFWRTNEKSWNKIFENMDYNISINIEILGVGSIRQPIASLE